MTLETLILWAVIGLIAGWLASMVMGTGFGLVGDGSYSLAANATKDLTVRFTPNALTAFNGTLTDEQIQDVSAFVFDATH